MTVRLPAGQDAGRRAVPDAHRVLRLPDRRAARPAPVGDRLPRRRRRTGRPARARHLDRGRLAHRAAARLRRGQRPDARLGLLRRRVRPVRPARRPTTATTRSRPWPRRAGSRAARSAWAASRSRASRSSSSPARGRRTWRPSRRCRSPTTSTPARATRAASSTPGFAQTWIKERMDDAKPAPEGGQPWARALVEAGRQALHRQPEAAAADPGRAPASEGEPVPHAVAVRRIAPPGRG